MGSVWSALIKESLEGQAERRMLAGTRSVQELLQETLFKQHTLLMSIHMMEGRNYQVKKYCK